MSAEVLGAPASTNVVTTASITRLLARMLTGLDSLSTLKAKCQVLRCSELIRLGKFAIKPCMRRPAQRTMIHVIPAATLLSTYDTAMTVGSATVMNQLGNILPREAIADESRCRCLPFVATKITAKHSHITPAATGVLSERKPGIIVPRMPKVITSRTISCEVSD